MAPFLSRKCILTSLPSHPWLKSCQCSRKLAKTPDLFKPRRVLAWSSARLLSSGGRLALWPGLPPSPRWMGSGEAVIPSGATAGRRVCSPATPGHSPVRRKHTELGHSLNFCYELLGSRAILFPSSAEDMSMSAGERES